MYVGFFVCLFLGLNCGIVCTPHFKGITLLLLLLYDDFLLAPFPFRTWSAFLNSVSSVPSFRVTVGAEGLKHYTF